jgi:hypothetical protein
MWRRSGRCQTLTADVRPTPSSCSIAAATGAANNSASDSLGTGLLTAMSLQAFLGLRYPVGMLPILLFEVTWKLIWIGTVEDPQPGVR